MGDSVTILLAAYESERYIGALLDSVFAQGAADFSVLARDDSSSDATFEILQDYAAREGRLTARRSERPSGCAQNNFFRLLLECEDSDYIMFADDDDFWLPDKVELTLARMKALESERGADAPLLVHGDASVADGRLNVTAPSLFAYEGLSPERTSLRCLLAQNNVTGCTVMINRALRALVPRQPESSVMHDWWLALCASAFGAISVIRRPLLLYRQHGGNEVGAYDAADMAASARRLADSRRSARIYGAMFAQAGCFADTFKDALAPPQLELCSAYASMAEMNKLQKIACIIKHGFYKNTFLRNIGQFAAI